MVMVTRAYDWHAGSSAWVRMQTPPGTPGSRLRQLTRTTWIVHAGCCYLAERGKKWAYEQRVALAGLRPPGARRGHGRRPGALRRVRSALGGTLKLIAHFGGERLKIA